MRMVVTNLVTRSEPTLAQLGSTGGNVADETTAALASGFTRGTRFTGGAVTSWAYHTGLCAISTQYTLSVFVVMDDASAPRPGNMNTSNFDLKLVVAGNAGVSHTVTLIDGTLYRVQTTVTIGGTIAANNSGVAQDAAQSGKPFVVLGYQLETGGQMGPYIVTTGSALARLFGRRRAAALRAAGVM